MATRDKNGRLHDSRGRFVKDSAAQGKVIPLHRNYVRDFEDYDSQGITPYRFGDTRPQFVNLDQKDYPTLESWYHRNGIAHAVIVKPAEDCVRNGWRVVIPSDPDKQAQYQKAMDDLNLKKKIRSEMIYKGLDGDGYLHWGLNEEKSTDVSTPIDPQNIKNIAYINAFGQKYVRKVEVNNNPTTKDYGKELTLVMDPTSNGSTIDPKTGNEIPNQPDLHPVRIDASRYAHISNDKLEDDQTGNSVLVQNADPIKVLDTALYSAGKILYEYSQKVLQSDHLSREDGDKYLRDMHVLSQGFTTESLVTMAGDEHLEKINTNVSGVQQLFDLAWQVLNTGTQIPKSVLLGEQSGTLAGASQDVQNYYDMIKSIQEEQIKPQLKRILKLLMWSQDVADGYEDLDDEGIPWDIEFNPLFTPDDKTRSETFVNWANGTSTNITDQVWSLDQGQKFMSGLANTQGALQNMEVQSQQPQPQPELQAETDTADLSPDDIREYEDAIKAVRYGGGSKADSKRKRKKDSKDKISHHHRKVVRRPDS